jgi:di/tricarboxylate transporter
MRLLGWSLVLVAPPLAYALAIGAGFSVQASIFAGLMLATVLLWIFRLVEEFAAPLVAIVGSLFVGLAPPAVALAGFASPSLLLLVGVFALSATMSASGLSSRLILQALIRVPDKPLWHQLTLLGSGYVLSPIVPSSNTRISLLKAPFLSMVEALRLPSGGPAITALLASLLGGSVLFGPMLMTSKSSNIAAISFLPQQLQTEFSGLFWLVAAFAALMVVSAAQLLITARLLPLGRQTALPRQELRQRLAKLGPLSASEWASACCFLFFVVGSATVSWHHLKAHVLAGCVLLALLITGTMQKQEFRRAMDWPLICFLLGIDSMVKIMDHLGLQQALARALQDDFAFVNGNIVLFVAASLLVTLTIRLVLPVTAGALSATVILLPIAASQSINPWIAVFCAAMFTDIAFFRYQGSNGLLQLESDGLLDAIDEPVFFQHNLWMNGARVIAVLASIPWWQALGIL